jgi:hypothetical protein
MVSMNKVAALVGGLIVAATAVAAPEAYDERGYRTAEGVRTMRSEPEVAGGLALVPGHAYLTSFDSNAILQADETGAVVGSLTPPGYTMGLRGSAFGPDGRLYVIAEVPTRYDVLVINEDGAIVRTLTGIMPIGGNISYGNLVVDERQDVYLVATTLQRIPRHASFASEISAQGAGFDIDLLDNGNLVIVDGYSVEEWTKTGSFVRNIVGTAGQIVDGRGVAYNPTSRQL